MISSLRKIYDIGISFLSIGLIGTTFLLLSSQETRGQTVNNLDEQTKAREITVRIYVTDITLDEGSLPYGSGVLIKRDNNDYYVVTNEHVAGQQDINYSVEVSSNESDQSGDIDPFITGNQGEGTIYVLKLIKSDKAEDVALLKFTVQPETSLAHNYQVAERAVSSKFAGQNVLVTGFPASDSSSNANTDTPATNSNPDTPATDGVNDNNLEEVAPEETSNNNLDQPATEDTSNNNLDQPATEDTSNNNLDQPVTNSDANNLVNQPVEEDANEQGLRFRPATVIVSDSNRLNYYHPNGFGAGMSGGSVLNEQGQLIGIHKGTESQEREKEGVGIPIDIIVETFKDIFKLSVSW